MQKSELDKQRAIENVRNRISRDMHDEIGSSLTKISLMSELLKSKVKGTETESLLNKMSESSRNVIGNMSEIIWALNDNNDYLENLIAYIRRFAAEYFENASTRLTISMPDNIPHVPISGEHRRNIFYVVKEALHNIIKHADASEAEIGFAINNNHLSIIIKDNGRGIPEERNRFGNGIRNMSSRMQSINGHFAVENKEGTKISLSLPVS